MHDINGCICQQRTRINFCQMSFMFVHSFLIAGEIKFKSASIELDQISVMISDPSMRKLLKFTGLVNF